MNVDYLLLTGIYPLCISQCQYYDVFTKLGKLYCDRLRDVVGVHVDFGMFRLVRVFERVGFLIGRIHECTSDPPALNVCQMLSWRTKN